MGARRHRPRRNKHTFMRLTLELNGQANVVGGSRKVFDHAGGTIGRQANNDWVLPDSYVSSRHAQISYADGVFYLESTGAKNPIYISSAGAETNVEKGRRYELRS